MPGLVYDAGALIAAERAEPRLAALHQLAARERHRPIVPVVALAQAWRGGPQPRLSLLLKGCLILPDDEPTGRAAGALCAVAGTVDVVAAIVVITAVTRSAAVVTSDPDDLSRLVQVLGVTLRLHAL
jgi:hypothetical protein